MKTFQTDQADRLDNLHPNLPLGDVEQDLITVIQIQPKKPVLFRSC